MRSWPRAGTATTEVKRVATGGSRPLRPIERDELRRLLDEIPIGAEHRDEPVAAFVRAWYRLHVPASAGDYAIHSLRRADDVVDEVVEDLLERLRLALDDPELGPVAANNCECSLCLELRGGRLLRA